MHQLYQLNYITKNKCLSISKRNGSLLGKVRTPNTGMRRSEMLTLKWENVDFDDSAFIISLEF